MIGQFLVYITLALSVGSTVVYLISANKNEKLNKAGSYLYNGVTLGLILMSLFLLSIILSHDYQYTYVYDYSSNELPLSLLISTFWAGQHGSFLLWAIFVAVIGYFLMPYARKFGYESYVMGFYSLILVFILLLMIFKNPFHFLWESYEGVEVGFTPKNGHGLNPILQNYWMAIHPPILFLGYAAMSVPFVFGLAGLFKRDYRQWIDIAIPWTLFATATLGLGIMIGGFWAYETLGWGGFWGWDPVENSSLLPWIVAVALVHTMFVYRKNGGLIKTNFSLAVISFVLVLYATFLTRSGILAGSSVHTFADPGMTVYLILLLFIVAFLLLGLFALLFRLKEIPNPKMNFSFTSKEFALSFGTIGILLSGLIIIIGTSWPILGPWFGQPKAAIDTSLYDQWNLPIWIVLLFVNALSLFFRWKSSDIKTVLVKSLPAILISIALTAVSVIMGVGNFLFLLLIFTAWLSMIINTQLIIKHFAKNFAKTGAYLSHVGLALLLLGALGSGAFSESTQLTLKEGEQTEAFGYTFFFLKKERIEKELTDREKYQLTLMIEKDGEKNIVKPVAYWSDFNKREVPYMQPGISRFLTKDIYVEPKDVRSTSNAMSIVLSKGHKHRIPLNYSVNMAMLGFDMAHSTSPEGEPNHIRMGCIIRFEPHEGESFVDTLYISLDMLSGCNHPEWYTYLNTVIEIGFKEFIPNKENMAQSQAVFYFREKGQPEPEPVTVFTFRVIIEPYINLVWIGTIILFAGFFIAMGKYTPGGQKKKKKKKKGNDTSQQIISDTAAQASPDRATDGSGTGENSGDAKAGDGQNEEDRA